MTATRLSSTPRRDRRSEESLVAQGGGSPANPTTVAGSEPLRLAASIGEVGPNQPDLGTKGPKKGSRSFQPGSALNVAGSEPAVVLVEPGKPPMREHGLTEQERMAAYEEVRRD